MAETEYSSTFGGAGNVSKSAIINMMEQRGIYVIENGEDPEDLTPGFATHLAYQGLVFWYDSSDATTAHDGVSCIVTADGKRFKSDGFRGAQSRFFKIVDKDLSAPPGSPTEGNSYIVAAGGSGAWATHDGKVASYTARGWLFTVPNAYDLALIIDESTIYHRSAGGSWVSGFPFFTIGANTVLPSALKYGRFGLTVVNQTTNTPPGSPTDGDAYIIGASPTGAWSGHARKIAIYESSAWVVYAPYEGATVYDAGTDAQVKYDGSSWVPQTSGYAAVTSVFTAALLTGGTSCGDYGYSPTTAPTTATANEPDTATLSHTAKKAGAVLEVEYQATFYVRNQSSGNKLELNCVVLGLQIDSAAAMADWAAVKWTDKNLLGLDTSTDETQFWTANVTFQVTTADALAHTYTVRWFADVETTDPAGTPRFRFSRRRFIIRERS